MSNPYWGNTFLEFMQTLVLRFADFFYSQAILQLASDEIQLLALLAVSLSCALLGPFLVWRKMAMLANALSHTILPGIVIAYMLHHFYFTSDSEVDFSHSLPNESLLIGAAIVMAMLTTFFTQSGVFLFRIQEDASTGIVFTFLFSLGIMLITIFTKSAHVGMELIMGNVDALQVQDLHRIFLVLFVNVALVVLFWRPFIVTSFDPVFAEVAGFSVSLVSYLLMAQVAVCAVCAFRAVGVLLFLAFLITPPLIARLWSQEYKKVVILSMCVAASSSVVGVAFSRHLLSVYGIACSTGALVSSVLALFFASSLLLSPRSPLILFLMRRESKKKVHAASLEKEVVAEIG